MKRLTLLSLALILATGCQLQLGGTTNVNSTNTEIDTVAADSTFWLNYFPTQCNQAPWGDNLDEESIIAYYENLGVNVISVDADPAPEGFFTCAACGCSTGETIGIQTDAAGRTILLEHGFTEETAVDELPIETNTNDNINTTTDATVPANSNVNASANEISETELVDPETSEDITVELSAADTDLRDRAQAIQAELAAYYSAHGSYPDTITDLHTPIDLTGLTYTPIGVTPADYYDLSVDYSTGREVVNP